MQRYQLTLIIYPILLFVFFFIFVRSQVFGVIDSYACNIATTKILLDRIFTLHAFKKKQSSQLVFSCSSEIFI